MSVEESKNQMNSTEQNQPSVDSVINWQLPVLAILFVSIIFVAIKTVVNRHETRTAYMELQKLEKQRDKLAAQWSRLKLEQGTALNQVRVEQYARWDLNMKMPKASEVKRIQEIAPAAVVASPNVDESLGKSSSESQVESDAVSKLALGN